MAIYHLSVQVISRSAGRSAVAAAAYRAGERLHDERTGLTHDFSRRREEIEQRIYAPEGAPEWVRDRSRLWNAVEEAERRRDSQLSREINVALPKELSRDQHRELIDQYVREQFVAKGMIADVAIHWGNPENPHAHIMLTMRTVGAEGFGAKERDWNRPEMLEQWRERWAEQTNRELERAGREERIDHRSLEAQGITERLPEIHRGPHVEALERQGIETERAALSKEIQEHNGIVIDLQQARVDRMVWSRELARLETGWWTSEEAQRVAEVERSLGEPLNYRVCSDRYEELREQHGSLQREIAGIEKEGRRLQEAERALNIYDKAARDVERLERPWERLKQVFSGDARSRYQGAKDNLGYEKRHVESYGVRDRTDLGAQKQAHSAQVSRIPSLQEKSRSLKPSMSLLGGALSVFREIAMRQARREREQQRERDRQSGRDRGWDRGR